MKKIILIGLAVVVLGAVTVGILKGQGKPEATVETGKVVRKDLTATVTCSGTIEPRRKVDVSANAMGTIVNLAVEEGQSLAAGDLLLEIDPSEYAAAVDALAASVRSARADLRLAEASRDKAVQDRDRAEELFAQGLASEENVDAARTSARVEQARVEAAQHRVEQVEANLVKARHDLTKVTLTAPMAGVVTRLNVEEGENAIMGTLNNPGTVLLTISDLGTMEAWVEVDETEVVKVALGQKAEVTIDAFPDSTFSGTVTEIANSPLQVRTGATREAVDFEVKILLDRAPANIRPGLSAKAEITVAERPQVLAVPLGAVTVREWPLKAADIRRYSGKRARQQERALADLGFEPRAAGADTAAGAADGTKRKETEGVFVIRDGFAKFVPVTIGIAGEDDFELVTGVGEGTVVVSGPFRILRELKDGARVETEKKKGRRGGRGGRDG
ncbi:MAG TPA: efflux RND transporter periplasmic adaptor subunit [Candidatus Krumholzibacteria bacterium]|nr:efflux RND transporter periplasmic adaptor subunit [Candidatus Krumholzibacteria bacterium]